MASGTASNVFSDALTGFGNRRKLVADLTEALDPIAPEMLFALFDLSGYEDYLGLYGQLRADAMLKRLAGRLSTMLDPFGACYRPRRNEFAALLRIPIETAQSTLESALAVLRTSDRERRVSITPAFGAVLLPVEAHDVTGVMMLADERLALTAQARPPRERRRHNR